MSLSQRAYHPENWLFSGAPDTHHLDLIGIYLILSSGIPNSLLLCKCVFIQSQ